VATLLAACASETIFLVQAEAIARASGVAGHVLDFVVDGGIPPTVDALRAWLLFRDVDISAWGTGPCKSVEDLFHEVPPAVPPSRVPVNLSVVWQALLSRHVPGARAFTVFELNPFSVSRLTPQIPSCRPQAVSSSLLSSRPPSSRTLTGRGLGGEDAALHGRVRAAYG
jgi:hypothetical protein